MTHSIRVLIVDDNKDAADSLAILLALWGHVVRVSYDGQAGLDLAPPFQPEAIILDISMPNLHGGQVAFRLRSQPEFQSTLIVAATALDSDDPLLDDWREYFDAFLNKPFNLSVLENMLTAHAASGK